MVKNLWHEVPRRPGVETESVLHPETCASTNVGECFEQSDVVTVSCEKAGSRQPAHTATNDDNLLFGHGSVSSRRQHDAGSNDELRHVTHANSRGL